MRQRRALYRGRCSTPARPNWAAISSWAVRVDACAPRVRDDGLVSVDMGIPQFDEPFDSP